MTVRSHRLVEYLISLSHADLTSHLSQKAVITLLDNLGCGLYGSQQRWGHIVNEFVASEGSRGNATLYGCATPVAPARAALANGTSTHGFEFDDALYAQSHPGAVVVSAALAVAEQQQTSGARLLLAIIAGYEMMGRLVQALGIDHGNRGYHTTGVAGPIAATIAAGIVMNLDVDQTLAAIGNACSSASGIKAFTQGTGGMTKRMHAGRAAESGVVACELAKRGFTGPMAAIDGRFGLLEVIGASGVSPEFLDADLGSSFAIDEVWVKVYPSCAVTHSTIHALEMLKHEHAFGPDQIKRMRVYTSQRGLTQNGARDPKDTMAAQYSLPFCAGVAAAKDARDPAAFAEVNLRDPLVCSLAERTDIFVDENIDRIYPTQLGARVEVSLNDGREVQATILDQHGTRAAPCTVEDIENKFRQLAGSVKAPETVDRIVQCVLDLPRAPSLQKLSAALRE